MTIKKKRRDRRFYRFLAFSIVLGALSFYFAGIETKDDFGIGILKMACFLGASFSFLKFLEYFYPLLHKDIECYISQNNLFCDGKKYNLSLKDTYLTIKFQTIAELYSVSLWVDRKYDKKTVLDDVILTNDELDELLKLIQPYRKSKLDLKNVKGFTLFEEGFIINRIEIFYDDVDKFEAEFFEDSHVVKLTIRLKNGETIYYRALSGNEYFKIRYVFDRLNDQEVAQDDFESYKKATINTIEDIIAFGDEEEIQKIISIDNDASTEQSDTKRDKEHLFNLLKAVGVSVLIIGGIFGYVSYRYTIYSSALLNIENYYFYQAMASFLLGALVTVGMHFIYKAIVNKNARHYLISTFILLIAFLYYYDKQIRISLYIENFSNRPKSVVVDGKRYEVAPKDELKLIFLKNRVTLDNETLQRGCYVVNLDYNNTLLEYGVSNSSNFGARFNFSPFESSKKITKIDSNGECTHTKYRVGRFSGEDSYYIYGHSKKLKEMEERSKNENKTKEH